MCNRKLKALVILLTILVIPSLVVRSAFGIGTPQASTAHIIKEVRHELVTLPYYGVFDWLQFQVMPDNTVVLRGQVVRPSTKADAGARVKEIDGVSKVVN